EPAIRDWLVSDRRRCTSAVRDSIEQVCPHAAGRMNDSPACSTEVDPIHKPIPVDVYKELVLGQIPQIAQPGIVRSRRSERRRQIESALAVVQVDDAAAVAADMDPVDEAVAVDVKKSLSGRITSQISKT